MEAHHASLGRKKLEEIRQKKAAEKMSSAALKSSNSTGTLKNNNEMEESGRMFVGQHSEFNGQRDYQALLLHSKELESEVREQKEVNKSLYEKVEVLQKERDNYEKQLRNIEENELLSLRRAFRDVSMEKDAAITSKEELSAQLRAVKRRLKEVEEEQYKTEEDAAALRAEFNLLQRQQEQYQTSSTHPFSTNVDEVRAMEQEMASIKIQLQEALRQKNEDQYRLAAEKERMEVLMAEKQQVEAKLLNLNSKILESSSGNDSMDNNSKIEKLKQENEKNQKNLHDLALMVERLERGRQKLLSEIDSQSLEIERLFIENSNLSSSLKDMTSIATEWENQAQECLQQNAELRVVLDSLRSEHANKIAEPFSQIDVAQSLKQSPNGGAEHASSAEHLKLKVELAKSQTKAEESSAKVLQLSVELKRAHQSYAALAHLYRPVIWNIENRLIQMKEDKFSEVAL